MTACRHIRRQTKNVEIPQGQTRLREAPWVRIVVMCGAWFDGRHHPPSRRLRAILLGGLASLQRCKRQEPVVIGDL
jgi:hypothetical protein